MQQKFEMQRQQMDAMQKQLEVLERNQAHQGAQSVGTNLPSATATTAASIPAGQQWPPTDPIRLFGNQRNYMNISFDGLFAAGTSTANDIEGGLELGAHDPVQRGFTVQNLELTLEGMVDPYFRGQGSIIYQIDSEGESGLEVEEAYLETVSLPGQLQLKAGQYFTEFGRLNQFHPHSWDFVDQPLVNGRFRGGRLEKCGCAIIVAHTDSTLLGTLSFDTEQPGRNCASFRNGNEGEPLFGRLADQGSVKSFNDLLFVARYVASFDLTDSQTIVMGASGTFGPNSSGRDTDTQIYGADIFWKWRPTTQSKRFPFVSWQTEAMLRRYQVGAFDWDFNGDGFLDADEQDANGDSMPDILSRETLTDWGMYSQVMWGFRPRWVLGLRGDYLSGDTADYERLYGRDLQRADRWRVSPNLTWHLTEFSKVRLQYNYDDRRGLGLDHSVWLQFEFFLGAHGAHKFKPEFPENKRRTLKMKFIFSIGSRSVRLLSQTPMWWPR